MADVVFLDTSVLLNILDVPGKNSDRDDVVSEFRRLVKAGSPMVVPIAAVIEVGNHLAQLPGDVARNRTGRFADFLRQALAGTPPWVVSGTTWDESFLTALVNGNGRPDLVELATQAVGSGDVSILVEVDRFLARTDRPSGQAVRLWTLDASLAAWA
jgi:hypothetical protein